jgi:hypothetical protein
MIVRNICDAAPDAIFWDLPLIPLAIHNVNAFISVRDLRKRMRERD